MISVLSATAYFVALLCAAGNIRHQQWHFASLWIGVMIFAAIIFGSSI